MLVLAIYATAALVLVTCSREALFATDALGVEKILGLSSASLACASLGSYSLRSSSSRFNLSLDGNYADGAMFSGGFFVECPVRFCGAEGAMVSDQSNGSLVA